jgi:outer membrane protein assembly factor BamB
MESLESYATAIPWVSPDGRKELLVAGGDVITGHDPASGTELWRWGTWNEGHRELWWRLVPSPVVGAGRVLVCAPKKAPIYAVKLGGSGALGADAVAWRSSGRPNVLSSDVPTPLYYAGRFFVLSDVEHALSRVDPDTGAIDWTVELPDRAPWEASPTGADGKIWCLSHAGEVVVVDAGSGKLLLRSELGEEDDDSIRSSIAVAHGAVFIRTNSTLFCAGS